MGVEAGVANPEFTTHSRKPLINRVPLRSPHCERTQSASAILARVDRRMQFSVAAISRPMRPFANAHAAHLPRVPLGLPFAASAG
jgi:hypothetical protein